MNLFLIYYFYWMKQFGFGLVTNERSKPEECIWIGPPRSICVMFYFFCISLSLWTLANQYHFTTWQLEQQLKLPEYANTVFFLLLVGKQWLWIFNKSFHIIFVFLNANKMVCINLCNFWDHFIQFSFNKRR